MARTFDGTNDQIAFGSESAIDNLPEFTASAIVRITANVTDERQILTKMNSSFVGKVYIAALGVGGSNNKIFCFMQGTGNDPYAESVADVLVVNTWRVIVVTFAGIFVTPPQIYACDIGGSISEVGYSGAPEDGSGTIEDDSGATLRVGSRDSADATFFSGGIAEVALWNRVLSTDEIRALGRGFAPAFFPRGRVFYSPLDGRHSPEVNWAGTTHGTVTEASYLDHPRVIYPSMVTPMVPTVGGSSFKSAWARGSNSLLRAL